MPTSLRNDYHTRTEYGYAGYVTDVDYRSRDWTNTVGYPASGRANEPENSYTDIQQMWVQKTTVIYGTYLWPLSALGTTNAGLNIIAPEGNTLYLRSQKPEELIFQYLRLGLLSDTSLLNEAKTKALLKAGDMKSNFAVSIAEANKTGDLILSTARRIDRAYRALRKGDFREVSRQLNISPKKVHNTWLEYRYGWLPLLMDVKGSAELLAQHHLQRADNFVVNGFAKCDNTLSRSTRGVGPGAWNSQASARGSKFARVKLRCRIDNHVVAAFQQMGLVNPALVAWELVPYSFVFDWFISVGDWLTACSALQGLDLISAMTSVGFEATGEYSQWFNPYESGGLRYWSNPSVIRGNSRSYVRSPLSLSGLIVYPVVNEDVFNMKRVITSLALMRSSSSRLVRI